MRPLKRPLLPDFAFGASPSGLLMNSFGAYCVYSEDPLPAEHRVWNRVTRHEESDLIEPTRWHEVVHMCENCFLSQEAHDNRSMLEFLSPDEDAPSFTLKGSSPLSYSLEKVSLVVEENGAIIESHQIEAVIVKGHTSNANATIKLFALNTPFFSDNTFRIPSFAYAVCFDRRVEQRTKAWRLATNLADRIKTSQEGGEDTNSALSSIIAQGRHAMAASGYWSTWISALLAAGVPFGLVSEVASTNTNMSWSVGAGPHNPLPGTNVGALFG